MLCYLLIVLTLLSVLANAQDDVRKDEHESCSAWAEAGECRSNPAYMVQSCATSCQLFDDEAAADYEAIKRINSFYELSAKDIDGTLIEFEKFRGSVTVVVNVASYCGYTESHYKQLVELFSHFKGDNVNILAFPCDQFGKQEPGTATEIKEFARTKGVEFTVMEKVDVNGKDSSIVYKYLKLATGLHFIKWNFATYFVIAPDGTVTERSGIDPLDLKPTVTSLLKEEL